MTMEPMLSRKAGRLELELTSTRSVPLQAPPAQRNVKETVVEMLEQAGYRREVVERALHITTRHELHEPLRPLQEPL
jgi:hypothetical protein